MSKLFTYKDNLGSLLKRSPQPFESPVSDPIYDGFLNISRKELEGFHETSEFEDYVSLSNSDYAIYSEKSKDTPYAKYTIISHPPINPSAPTQSDSQHVHRDGMQISPTLHNQPNEPLIKDVIVSKQFEESYMSTINRVYIGSLTIVGLYVLFRYLKE
jgi:hypothetical protein